MTTGRPRDLVGRPLAGLGGVQGPRGPALLGLMGLRADWIAQGGGGVRGSGASIIGSGRRKGHEEQPVFPSGPTHP